jgi:solute:Na+ symporter, SSS family
MDLGVVDIAVLGGYMALLGGTAIVLNQHTGKHASGDAEQREYFLAGRSMPTWAVAISMLATTQSAAALLGGPEEASKLDLRYLWTNLGVLVATALVILVFVPVYFKLNVATPYELIRRVYGAQAQKWTAGWYLVGRLLANGARLYLGSVPFCLAIAGEVTFTGVLLCIAGFSLFGALFTLKSGARGAIYSDVVQAGVYLFAMLALTGVVWWKTSTSDPDWTSMLRDVVLFGPIGDNFDLTKQYTILASIVGWSLLNLGFFAMDQDLTQRLLACRDAKTATRSMLVNTLALSIPVTLLFMLLGLLIAAQNSWGGGESMPPSDVVVWIATKMQNAVPGMLGLLLAGVLAAGPAGINGSLNAMSSALINDLLEAPRRGWSAQRVRKVGYLATGGFGVLMGASACLAALATQAKTFDGILGLALGIMVPAFAGLVPVFGFAMWHLRGSRERESTSNVKVAIGSAPAIAGLLSGSGLSIVLMFTTTIASPWRLLAGCVVGVVVCWVVAKITARDAASNG